MREVLLQKGERNLSGREHDRIYIDPQDFLRLSMANSERKGPTMEEGTPRTLVKILACHGMLWGQHDPGGRRSDLQHITAIISITST